MICGGAFVLAACANTSALVNSTPKTSTTIYTPTTLVAPSATVAEADESGVRDSTTTLVAPSTTIAEADESGDTGSTTMPPSEPGADDDPKTSEVAFVPIDLAIGTCFDDPPNDVDRVTPDDIPVVECASPHANEVFHSYDIGGQEFPGDASIHIQADSLCYDAFEGYVGITYESSVYDFSWYFPTAESWSIGGTSIICFAYNTDLTSVTGSVEGTGR
jgi:hypothetical protein